jgi:hypothetical protein
LVPVPFAHARENRFMGENERGCSAPAAPAAANGGRRGGQSGIASDVVGMHVRIDDVANGLGRQRTDRRSNLIGHLRKGGVHEKDAEFAARLIAGRNSPPSASWRRYLHRHIPARANEHRHLSLNRNDCDLSVLEIRLRRARLSRLRTPLLVRRILLGRCTLHEPGDSQARRHDHYRERARDSLRSKRSNAH